MNRRELFRSAGGAAAALLVPAATWLRPGRATAQEDTSLTLYYEQPSIVVENSFLGTFDNTYGTYVSPSWNNLTLDQKWYALFGAGTQPPRHHPYARMREAQLVADEIARRQAVAFESSPHVIEGYPPAFQDNYSSSVANLLVYNNYGLYWAEALAVAFFLEGALRTLEPEVYGALKAAGMQLIYQGLAAGTIGAYAEFFGSGLFVGLTMGAAALAGIALIGITLYYVWPEIERQIRATSESPANYSGMLTIQAE